MKGRALSLAWMKKQDIYYTVRQSGFESWKRLKIGKSVYDESTSKHIQEEYTTNDGDKLLDFIYDRDYEDKEKAVIIQCSFRY